MDITDNVKTDGMEIMSLSLWSCKKDEALSLESFREFIEQYALVDRDPLPTPELGGTGYLDQWESFPREGGYGKDEHGRWFFVTPEFKVNYTSYLGKINKEKTLQICFFERYVDQFPIVSTERGNCCSPFISVTEALDFAEAVKAMNGDTGIIEKTDCLNRKSTWEFTT